MNAEIGRAAFRLAMTITFPALVLLAFVQPGTAEFLVTLMSLCVGVTFLSVVAFLAVKSQR